MTKSYLKLMFFKNNMKTLKIILILILGFILFSKSYLCSDTDKALILDLKPDELSLRSGEKLQLDLTAKNISYNTIHTECLQSEVIYNPLGITVKKDKLEWDTELLPFEEREGEQRFRLPVYTLPGTYTIKIWAEYEGVKSDPVICTLHYHNLFLYVLLACILNIGILYLFKRFSSKTSYNK